MDAVRTLGLRAISDSGSQTNNRWLFLFLAALSDGVIYGGEITTNSSVFGPPSSTLDVLVTIIHAEHLPTVSQESSFNVLSKSDSGVSVNGDAFKFN